MLRFLGALFLILHRLIRQVLVVHQPVRDSTTRLLASVLRWGWSASLVSTVTILLFWDGSLTFITQNGLIGFLIGLMPRDPIARQAARNCLPG